MNSNENETFSLSMMLGSKQSWYASNRLVVVMILSKNLMNLEFTQGAFLFFGESFWGETAIKIGESLKRR